MQMKDILIIIISMAAASFVGGMTNYLAIKMLFHPRNKKYIGSRAVPFTPGLIPKRREDIAISLGRVVADYLVTSHGISNMLNKPEFKEKANKYIVEWVHRWIRCEDSLDKLIRRRSPEHADRMKLHVTDWISQKAEFGVRWLYEQYGSFTATDLLGDTFEQHKENLSRMGSRYLLEALQQELSSLRGERMIRSMTASVLDKAGGFMGTLAGLFMDESKVGGKIKDALVQQLDTEEVRQTVQQFMEQQLDRAGGIPVIELIEWLSGEEESAEWLARRVRGWPLWEKGVEQLLHVPLASWFAEYESVILAQVPKLTERLFESANQNMERMIGALRLPEIVEAQVKTFPVERIEEIILSVSGKEFRAITWLGAVLGGLIGIMQSIIMIAFRI